MSQKSSRGTICPNLPSNCIFKFVKNWTIETCCKHLRYYYLDTRLGGSFVSKIDSEVNSSRNTLTDWYSMLTNLIQVYTTVDWLNFLASVVCWAIFFRSSGRWSNSVSGWWSTLRATSGPPWSILTSTGLKMSSAFSSLPCKVNPGCKHNILIS